MLNHAHMQLYESSLTYGDCMCRPGDTTNMYPLLRRIFAQFDENDDGYVDSHELARGLVSSVKYWRMSSIALWLARVTVGLRMNRRWPGAHRSP